MSLGQMKQEEAQLRQMIKEGRKQVQDTTLVEYCRDIEALTGTRSTIKLRRTLRGHNGKVYALHWARDNKTLVSTAQDGKLIIWNAAMGLKQQAITLQSTWVMSCAFSPSAKFVAAGGLDNICTIYDASNPDMPSDEPTRRLQGHTGYLSCCRFLDDSKMLTSSGDLSCGFWDITTSRMVSRFTGHNGDVMFVSVSPNGGQTFVSGACDAQAKLWDLRTGKCCQTFAGHDSDINAVSFFPDGNCFATASDDTTCRLFDIRADQEVSTYQLSSPIGGGNRSMTSCGFSKSGRLLFGGCEDFNVYIWDTLRSEQVGTLPAHEGRVSSLGISDDGFAIATGSWDSTMRVWS